MARVYYDEEAEYLRSLERERIELVGPTVEYYSLNRGMNVDALYGEPTNDPLYGGSSPIGTPSRDEESWNFYPDVTGGDPALTMSCAMEYEQMTNREFVVREEGLTAEYDAIMVISRDAWECALEELPIVGRVPKVGDVVYVYNEWWDVIKVGSGGNILDSPNYTGYRFELKKRTKFTPDRKVG